MRKSRLYRGGAAFLAALMVVTGMPQGQMYVSANEGGILMEGEEYKEPDQLQTVSVEELDEQKEQENVIQSEENEGSAGQDEGNQPEPGAGNDEDGSVQPEESQSESGPVGQEPAGDVPAGDLQAGVENAEPAEETGAAPQEDTPVTYTITGPEKTTYLIGEEFDSKGIQIKSSASPSQTIPITEATVSLPDFGTPGKKTLTITYGGETKSISILVLELPTLEAKYGQLLSEITLPNVENGSWAWEGKPQETTINKVGTTANPVKYSVRFKPTDPIQFQQRTGDATLNVTCDLSKYAEIKLPSEAKRGYTYDGTEKKPQVTVSVGDSNLSLNRDYTVDYKDNIDAGTASVIVTGIGSYAGEGSEKTETFSIAKARLRISAKDNTVYCGDLTPGKDDGAYQFEYTVSGLGKGDTIEPEPKFTCKITSTESAGTYEISLDGAGVVRDIEGVKTDVTKINYETIEYIEGTLTVKEYEPQTVVIAGLPSELDTTYSKDISGNKIRWPYEKRAVVRVSGSSTAVSNVALKAHYEGITEAGDKYDEDTAPTDAGDYELTYTLVDEEAKNYVRYVFSEGSNTFPFKIKQKEIIITAPSKKVVAGEQIPKADSEDPDVKKAWQALMDAIKVEGFLRGDTWEKVLGTRVLTLAYDGDNISSAQKGEYDIIPDVTPDEDGERIDDKNYTLVFIKGTLEVEGRKSFKNGVDFTSIKADDKTYDGQPHSISGPASDESGKNNNPTFTYTIQLTNETRKREEEKKPEQGEDAGGEGENGGEQDENGGSQDENGGSEELPDYIKQLTGVPITEIVKRYQEIAPTEVGRYKLEIFSEVDTDIYEYDGEALMKRVFYVTLLQKNEMRLAGVTGIKDKEYDGEPFDLSNQIKNAKLLTEQGLDITEEAKLTFSITGTTVYSEDGEQDYYYSESDKLAGMPQKAGKYELHVELVEKEPRNYVANEWTYPFEIKRRKVSITVDGQEMHVGDGGKLEAGSEQYKDKYQIEGVLDDDKAKFVEKLKVVLGQTVVTDKPGVYDLELDGLNEADWPDYEITWTNAKLTVKGQLHRIKEELKAVTNVPNGTTLEEIAASYLPKKTTIYLYKDGKAPVPNTPAEGDTEDPEGTEDSEDPKEPVRIEEIEETAEIVWDTTRTAPGTSYNINTKTPQTFKMKGTVQLPELIYADPDTSLTVTVSVSVREAYNGQALRPVADIKTGSVSQGTKVRLSTAEEGAEIIYTIEADNPAFSVTNRRYTEPIEIRNTMTIRAIARVEGKRDSEELRVTYYLDKTLKPGGNDPNDPDPDVPAEDIPKDENGRPLKIPNGLWVTDVKGYIYTGKAIKPEVRVYDYKTRLEEKKDYTISYKNNTNAADKASAKAPTITITGKGNYEGKLLKTFTIAPKNINDSDVKADDLTVAFNNKAQKPVPVLTWNGKKLGSKDYSYDGTAQIAVGTYTVKLSGTGNYTGERNISFNITDGVPVSKLTVSKISAYTYTGNAIMPEPIVKYGKEVLAKDKDYKLSYEDNIKVGTASVIITGTGDAKLSKFFGVKRVTFSINAVAAMNKAKAELRFEPPAVYTGKEITASAVEIKANGVSLVKDKDYKVTYQNNIKAGTATAVFEGINGYSGTLKKTFKISAYDLQMDPQKKLNIQMQESYPYMKGGSTQKPVIKFDGKTLTEGTDYTLSYKNHTAAGNYAAMTIKGKGNFTGSVLKGYAVTVQDIKELTVVPEDKAYQPKANIYKTTVRVLDSNGKALSAGKDYDKNFTYTYVKSTKVNDAATGAVVTRKAGEAVAATDLIPALTEIRVTVSAAGNNYQGTASGTYRIGRASLAKANVTVPPQTYTGKAIEPKETEITVVLNGMVISSKDYKIISYTNNVNKGTAKLTIQGQGENYGGTKTVTFKIKGKSLLAQIIG